MFFQESKLRGGDMIENRVGNFIINDTFKYFRHDAEKGYGSVIWGTIFVASFEDRDDIIDTIGRKTTI